VRSKHLLHPRIQPIRIPFTKQTQTYTSTYTCTYILQSHSHTPSAIKHTHTYHMAAGMDENLSGCTSCSKKYTSEEKVVNMNSARNILINNSYLWYGNKAKHNEIYICISSCLQTSAGCQERDMRRESSQTNTHQTNTHIIWCISITKVGYRHSCKNT